MTAAPPSPQPDARYIGRPTKIDVKEVIREVSESLRAPGFAGALALLLAQNERDTSATRSFTEWQ
jgi:hypothetical protein